LKVKAKKYLGQHFLKDEQIAQKIVSLMPESLPKILEIGSGTGILTKYLLPIWKENFYAIEIDKDSVQYLVKHLPELSTNLLNEDFLKFSIANHFEGDLGIIGNFPYNISSPIFFKVLENRQQVKTLVGMVQKEVGKRIAAKAGSKTYGILSVLLQAYYDIEYVFTVKPQVFNPPPKVDSAVIFLQRNQVEKLACNEKLFKTIVKLSFGQRRKTLRNSLKSLQIPEEIRGQGIFGKRPEQLSVEGFVELTQLMEK